MRTERNATIRRTAAAMLAGLLLAGACSSEDKADESSQTVEGERSVGAPEVPEECSTQEPEADTSADASQAVAERGRPDVAAVTEEFGDSTEPVDLVVGEGDPVILEGSAELHSTFINPATGTEEFSSWDPPTEGDEPQPQVVPLAQTTPALTEAIDGMLVGGRRAFTLPASEIFGEQLPEGMTADSPLLIVLDLVSVSADSSGSSAETDADALAAAEERGAPEVTAPEGDETTDELIVIDDVVGEGEVVCPGDTVVAHYTGVEAANGEQFDSSWERGEPIDFGLDGVIQGWTEGLVGMQVGGRRTLVIPAEQAYGEEPQGGQPGGVLVFTIDLVGLG